MAEISRLAHKQMEYLFDSNPKAHFEKRILNDAIFFPFQKRGAFVLCTSSNIGEIIQRLNEFHLIVIGIQTDIEDDLPLHTFNVEDYSCNDSIQQSIWISEALADLLSEHKEVWLRFYIDITEQEVEILVLKSGIPCF